ncbi:MAG: COX15/CtaA family protein [Pseudomonadota bacterium]|nr:COX15/CtaA family protein [Pseudomonadota bacterium]
MDADGRLRVVVYIAAVVACVVIVLGAYTRLVDAGLGCPDWPGCYGMLGVPESIEQIRQAEARYPEIPVEPHKAWTEMVHRYVATGLGALCFCILGLAWFQGRRLLIPIVLTAVVIVQGIFGAWTVTLKLWPQVVTAHLLGGFATLSVLWWYAASLRPTSGAMVVPRKLARIALVAVLLQIALGGWVTSNYAALACPDFPTCHRKLIPPMDFERGFDFTQTIGPNYLGGQLDSDARIAIQVTHRIGAVVVLLLVGLLVFYLRAQPFGWALGSILGLQWALGISNVLFNLPLWVAVLHNAGGAALLLMVLTLNVGFGQTRERLLVKGSKSIE